MKGFVRFTGTLAADLVAILAFGQTSNPSADKQLIPLKEIWAYEMPGTRDVRDLEPDMFGPSVRKLSSAEQLKKYEKSLTSLIGSQLQYNKPAQSASQAFAVAGTEVEALHEAAAVLSGKRKPQASFPTSSNLSIVFFSHPFNYYVHLDRVEKQPGQIVISYRFVPHETKEMTTHFALIPIGKLAPGEVKVDIRRLPMGKKFTGAGFKEPSNSWETRVVAQSFRFTVEGRGD